MERVLGMTFTYHMSLQDWVELGLFDREKQIYEEHLRQGHFEKVIWFTYGINDSSIRDSLVKGGLLDDRISVVGVPHWAKYRLLRYIYSYLLPIIQRHSISELTVIKSNQMGGARVAAAIARKTGSVFELRTGYTYTLFFKRAIKQNKNYIKKIVNCYYYTYYSCMEKKLYRRCDFATVSSKADKEYLCKRYGVNEDKIQIVTNYIDTDRFCKLLPLEERQNRFLFVGRLSEQKNLLNLVKAFVDMDIGVDIYGDGEMNEQVKQLAGDLGADVVLKGRVSNYNLPQIYNNYRFFILPSYYEGMPKTLLEAMACGCICLGTDVEGIREVLVDKNNGFIISGTSCEDMLIQINEVYDNKDIKILKEISDAAVRYVCNNHSISDITRREYLALKKNKKLFY